MKYNQDYFYSEELLFQLSKSSGLPVMYIRADGPNSVEDSTERNEIWEFYYGKCDNVILGALQDKGEVYCYFKTETEAFNAFHEWFPQKSQLLDEEMQYYIHVYYVNASTGVSIVNG
jgi:hypothetical protein